MYRPFRHRLTVTDVPDLASGARVVVFEKVYKTNRGAVAARRRWLAGGAWSHRSATITTIGRQAWFGVEAAAPAKQFRRGAVETPEQPATDCTQPASNEVPAAQKTGGTKGEDTI